MPMEPSDPVFVLCAGRSGSTLLRFLLDAHPELMCPPENRLPELCAQLAGVWSAASGTPLTQKDRKDTPSAVPDTAIAGVRRCADLTIDAYLARTGKRRYCDKNLGTARHAELLTRMYPGAKFLCLYRHPMDVVASAVEACPWGLRNYGFEPYIAATPGNSVQAMTRYWADHTTAVLAVEERFPERCLRIRYEELVTDPESVAGEIFGFLGVEPQPGISARCFSMERERGGGSDYKIWSTDRITADSVGRGWLVPANLIQPPLRARITALTAKLGYVPVGGDWGIGDRPADLTTDGAGRPPAAAPAVADGSAPVLPGVQLVTERLQTGVSRADEEFTRRWKPYSEESFLVQATVPGGTNVWWRVDPVSSAVHDAAAARHDSPDGTDWAVTAPADTWDQVIRGGVNIGVAFRRHGMRYTDGGDAGAGSVTANNRVAMLADLLGIVRWGAK
jgi:sulfotransferase family protein